MIHIIKKTLLVITIFLLFLGVELPVYAMSPEEKELFDALCVEYSVDENGDFKEFHVEPNMERMTFEQKKQLAKKYENISQVGEYEISFRVGDTPDEVYMEIVKDGKFVYVVDNCVSCAVIYVNADGSFHTIGYSDADQGEAIEYTEGNCNILETGYNTYTCFEKKADGTFGIVSQNNGYNIFQYDENGELKSKLDLVTMVTYNAEGTPIYKELNCSDQGFRPAVPYSVAEEVQRLVDENGGSFYTYVEQADVKAVLPEIQYLILEGKRAWDLGISLEEYRELHNIYEEVEITMPTIMQDMVEIEWENDFNQPEIITKNEIPSSVSEPAIAEELTRLINDYRVEKGIEPLDTSDVLLQEVANLRVEESIYVMNSRHSRPLAGTASAFHIGENLAKTSFDIFDSSEDIARILFEAWKSSPGHNENMLSEDYKQGALSVKFVKENGRYVAYAVHDFSRMSDYQNLVSDITKKRIAIGPQVPGNIENVNEYYEKLYHDNSMEDTLSEETDADNNDAYSGEEVAPYGLQVLDENGNKFQLPNGEEWVSAHEVLQVEENMRYDMNGNPHSITWGHIVFQTETGEKYWIAIEEDGEDVLDEYGNSIKYIEYLNNISGDTIVLKQSAYKTLSQVYPEGYAEDYVSEYTYYILNGEKLEYTW